MPLIITTVLHCITKTCKPVWKIQILF